MTNQASQEDEIKRWEPALYRLLKKVTRTKWFGTIHIEVVDGKVKRLRIERSIIDPKDLIPEKVEKTEALAQNQPASVG